MVHAFLRFSRYAAMPLSILVGCTNSILSPSGKNATLEA